MDIVDGKIFHREVPPMLRRKLKTMSFLERQKLLENLEDPSKKSGVMIKEYNIYFEAR